MVRIAIVRIAIVGVARQARISHYSNLTLTLTLTLTPTLP
jgi:hypothetical protein